MAINFSIAWIKNPAKKEEPAKCYAVAQSSGVVGIDEIAEEIAYATTLTDGDVLNVLRALIRQTSKNLMGGKIVSLESFGRFYLQLHSEGAETKEAFTQANIKKVSIRFRPGVLFDTTTRADLLTFKQVPPLPKRDDEDAEEPGEGGGPLD